MVCVLVAGANDFSEQGLIVLVGWGVLSYSWSYAWSTILFLIGVAANVISYSRRPWFDAEPPLPRKFRKGGREAPDNRGGGSGVGGGGGGGVCESVGKVLGVIWAELVGFIVPLRHKPFLYLVLYQVRANRVLATNSPRPWLAASLVALVAKPACATTLGSFT